jgi:hypothetical protein
VDRRQFLAATSAVALQVGSRALFPNLAEAAQSAAKADFTLRIAPVSVELAPGKPGDTLRVESEVLEILPSRSKPNQGIVKVRSTTLNQDGEPVYVFTAKVLVFKRTTHVRVDAMCEARSGRIRLQSVRPNATSGI